MVQILTMRALSNDKLVLNASPFPSHRPPVLAAFVTGGRKAPDSIAKLSRSLDGSPRLLARWPLLAARGPINDLLSDKRVTALVTLKQKVESFWLKKLSHWQDLKFDTGFRVIGENLCQIDSPYRVKIRYWE